MTNNDVLRALRYALELDNLSLLELFARGDAELTLRDLANLLKDEGELGHEPLPDAGLECLLDGLIEKRRGKREPAPDARPRGAQPLTNNRILRALRIALELKDGDILEILRRGGIEMSKTELSALFRREEHRNYQPCGDQVLRYFLRGLADYHRAGGTAKR